MRGKRAKQLHVVTHELRPRKDNTGWNINVEFVPKRYGVGKKQPGCTTRGVEARYWDNRCKVMKRSLDWCGQLVFDPFAFDFVRKDKDGWSVSVSGELKRELRLMFSVGTCYWVFGLARVKKSVVVVEDVLDMKDDEEKS